MGKGRRHRAKRSTSRRFKSGGQPALDEIKFKGIATTMDGGPKNLDKQGEGKAKEVISMPHLNSKSSQIKAMGNCTWGITAPDKLLIRTKAVRDKSDWKLEVTHVNSVVRSYSRLLKGQKEPVPGVNTTKSNFKSQINELNRLGSCKGKWYMIRAVRAHENVHVKEWKDNFKTDWAKQRTNIESLKVPASGKTKHYWKAYHALRTLPAFQKARLTSNSSGNYPTFWGIADPNPQTDAAEKAIVNPRIAWICKYAKWNKWNPATNPVCRAKKIT